MSARDEQFEEFVGAASLRLLRAARLLTGDDGRAEDLVQDALARTYLRWDRIEAANPLSYARRTMLNAYVDWWRRRPWREQPHAELPDAAAPGADTAERQASSDALLRALAGLSRSERAVLVLRYYEDLSEAEIAETLSMARGTVKSTSSRALRKLRCSPHLRLDNAEAAASCSAPEVKQ